MGGAASHAAGRGSARRARWARLDLLRIDARGKAGGASGGRDGNSVSTELAQAWPPENESPPRSAIVDCG